MLNDKKLREEIVGVLKAQQWEKCKGELRAFIALDGAKYSEYETQPPYEAKIGKWEKIEALTNDFIAFIEENGLHE